MNAEDKRILMKIVGSIAGMFIMGYLFGFLGVIISLVAIYFVFKNDNGKQIGEDPESEAKAAFIWFCVMLVLGIVLAYLFGIIGVIIGLGLIAGAIYNIMFG